MRIRDIIKEAPLADYQPLGDLSKPGSFRGVDKRLIPHPTNQLKTAKFFENTPYDFRLFFNHDRKTSGQQYQEHGAVSANDVMKVFGPEIGAQIVNGHESAITIVFMGNYGADKVMLTPWVMAHRLGHAIMASMRRPHQSLTGKSDYSRPNPFQGWKEADQYWYSKSIELLRDVYKKREAVDEYTRLSEVQPFMSAMFNAIGTQRSSREGMIKRPYEFLYEIFAQYLKDGQVTLNPLPRQVGFGRQAWGRQTNFLTAGREHSDQELANRSDMFANDMTIMFSSALAECEGKIFFM